MTGWQDDRQEYDRQRTLDKYMINFSVNRYLPDFLRSRVAVRNYLTLLRLIEKNITFQSYFFITIRAQKRIQTWARPSGTPDVLVSSLSCASPDLRPGFRIRIDLMRIRIQIRINLMRIRIRIRIQHFSPDPDPGFDDLKLKKIYSWKFNFYFLDQKLQFIYP